MALEGPLTVLEHTPDGPAFIITTAAALRPDTRLTILLSDEAVTVWIEHVALATQN